MADSAQQRPAVGMLRHTPRYRLALSTLNISPAAGSFFCPRISAAPSAVMKIFLCHQKLGNSQWPQTSQMRAPSIANEPGLKSTPLTFMIIWHRTTAFQLYRALRAESVQARGENFT